MKLISTNIVENGDQKIVINSNKVRDFFVAQVTASATSTVIIQGRCGKEHDWIDIVTLTDTAADTVAWFPFMRASVTARTGTVEVDLAGG